MWPQQSIYQWFAQFGKDGIKRIGGEDAAGQRIAIGMQST